jgi:hypothetical protein
LNRNFGVGVRTAFGLLLPFEYNAGFAKKAKEIVMNNKPAIDAIRFLSFITQVPKVVL